VSREAHAGFCERRRVRLPPPTLLVVLVAGTRTDAESLRAQVAAVLAEMGLRLSEAKTRVVHIDEGLEFLGFRIQRHPRRGTTRRHIYTYLSKAAMAAVKTKVRAATRQGTNQPLAALLRRLNPVLRGWANYFRHGVSKATFNYLRALRLAPGRFLASPQAPSDVLGAATPTLPACMVARARRCSSIRRGCSSPGTAGGATASPRRGPGASGREGQPRSPAASARGEPVARQRARRVRRREPGKRTAPKGDTAPRLDPTTCCDQAPRPRYSATA
jgi:hypothetical protein